MKAFAIPLLLALAGCQSLPSFEACSHTKYERNGNQLHIEADCNLPVQPVSLPNPMSLAGGLMP